MKKIVRVVLKNFMSHKHTDVGFSDFTAIIGPSDNGKSALIKGIKKVLYNMPSGDDFIRKEYDIEYNTSTDEEGNEIKVEASRTERPSLTFEGTVYFDDGTSITRTKGPKANSYDLVDSEGGVLHLEAFGVGPVKEVVDFHGMREVNFFGEKQALNIAGQFEQPFFLAESSATRAVMIGKLGNTKVVDLAIKNTAGEMREANAEIKKYKVEIKDINAELKDLKGLAKMGKDIEKIKKNMEKIAEISKQIENISRSVDGIVRERAKKAKLEYTIAMEDSIEMALSKIEGAISSMNRVNEINKINGRLITERNKKQDIENFLLKADINKVNEVISKVDTAVQSVNKALLIKKTTDRIIIERGKKEKLEKLVSGADVVDKALENISKCKDIISLHSKLALAQAKVQIERERKSKGQGVITTLESSYSEAINKYKNNLLENPICPMCAGAITKEQVMAMKEIF